MKTSPIKDLQKIEKIKEVLARQSKRDLLLFVMAINSGLRITDLLELKLEDVIDEDEKPKKLCKVKEQKTGKTKKIVLNDNIRKILLDYIGEAFLDKGEIKGELEKIDENELNRKQYLFKSRKGGNKPISRQHAWHVFNKAAREAGINQKISSHTLRKTFGYHAYKAGMDISLLQYIFNHAAPSITLKYIEVEAEDMDNVYVNINL